jgi:hypothetical protein
LKTLSLPDKGIGFLKTYRVVDRHFNPIARHALGKAEAEAGRIAILFAVPELTCNAGIQLNARVSLRDHAKAIASSHRILFPSGPTMAKPSGDHIPLGGFVFRRSGCATRLTILMVLIDGKAPLSVDRLAERKY